MTYRSEKYRRLIAEMPCASCGLEGYTQVAHKNEGKGMGLKSSDATCFPLCADRPGVVGCHSIYDRGDMLREEKRIFANNLLARTLVELIENGILRVK